MVEWDGLVRPGESDRGGKIVVGIREMNRGFVYILKCIDKKLYIGSTRNLSKRIESHKMGRVKTTKGRRPVQLLYTEEFETYKEARERELYLKTGTGRDWLKSNLEGCQSG